jgi:hypothetical protein
MRLFKIYIASCFLVVASCVLAANDPIAPLLQKQTLLDKKQKSFKSGPYFGLQSGRFYVLEYGWELQYKNKKGFLNANTTALHHGFNATFDCILPVATRGAGHIGSSSNHRSVTWLAMYSRH